MANKTYHVMSQSLKWQVIAFAVAIEGITVRPSLCPTNKIAPHQRTSTRRYVNQRTFGAVFDLLSHDNLHGGQINNLQEQPLADDPEDCGVIEDYDENDVSSVTTESARRHAHVDQRYFFEKFFQFLTPTGLGHYSEKPTGKPTRPPYASGGIFAGNPYRPPSHLYPSDYVKPVHEDAHERPLTYRPGIVGGPLGHIVGVTQVRPTNRPPETTSNLNMKYINSVRFSSLPSQVSINSNRRPRDRIMNDAHNGIFSSFIDLFV
ncbi:uncharacterized protein [Battus philenor]|uniref:uncharacterized protein n=1 Tax=Battus philenor TaxID=42288 RepID=UPI0035D01C32